MDFDDFISFCELLVRDVYGQEEAWIPKAIFQVSGETPRIGFVPFAEGLDDQAQAVRIADVLRANGAIRYLVAHEAVLPLRAGFTETRNDGNVVHLRTRSLARGIVLISASLDGSSTMSGMPFDEEKLGSTVALRQDATSPFEKLFEGARAAYPA